MAIFYHGSHHLFDKFTKSCAGSQGFKCGYGVYLTSVYSFAAEVEYHARFLVPLAKIKIPFLGRSLYDSAIRADMTIGASIFEGFAPFHRSKSKIVNRQRLLHEQIK